MKHEAASNPSEATAGSTSVDGQHYWADTGLIGTRL